MDQSSFFLKTLALFTATAIAEIIGCYLPYLWLRKGGSVFLLLPAALSLMIFVWLLTLHPAATGRIYAAYGGVYVCMAVLWLWLADGIMPDRWDIIGSLISLIGMAVILLAPRAN
ncbi:YnfA family protein [Iodobacter arcticus]|uniref:YnfA family protein n=1 Tax=Iodobacter arcticus TaxID=590593 RepID=A0ABW2R6P4_9NEIS